MTEGTVSQVRTAGRLALAAVLLVLLSGCWFSHEPLIGAENASDFPYTGTYADPESGASKVVIAPGPDRSYELRGPDAVIQVHFLDLGEDWYIYQMMDAGDEGEPDPAESRPTESGEPDQLILYNMMKYSDGSLLMYEPDCDEDTAAIDGIEDDGHGCRIASLAALKEAGRRFIRAVEAGTMAKEPDVLRRWTGD